MLFPIVAIASSDIDSLPSNTVFRRLVRDIHVRQYQLRADAVRAVTAEKLSEVRGRVDEMDRLLGTLHSYLIGDPNAHADGSDTDDDDFEVMTLGVETEAS